MANVITCSGSAALCMSSLYKLRVLLLCHPTGNGSDDAKIKVTNERRMMMGAKCGGFHIGRALPGLLISPGLYFPVSRRTSNS